MPPILLHSKAFCVTWQPRQAPPAASWFSANPVIVRAWWRFPYHVLSVRGRLACL